LIWPDSHWCYPRQKVYAVIVATLRRETVRFCKEISIC
jgi:hypothetical protein